MSKLRSNRGGVHYRVALYFSALPLLWRSVRGGAQVKVASNRGFAI